MYILVEMYLSKRSIGTSSVLLCITWDLEYTTHCVGTDEEIFKLHKNVNISSVWNICMEL